MFLIRVEEKTTGLLVLVSAAAAAAAVAAAVPSETKTFTLGEEITCLFSPMGFRDADSDAILKK